METRKIIEFYNNYLPVLQKSGINDRILHLYRRLLCQGLKSSSNVLELGSGIGKLTYLLSRRIKTGHIEAVDISNESVEFCRRRLKKANISFYANDIVQHVPSIKKIDFITLFDVIEHIPVERHDDLFRNISSISDSNTKILINIPNPEYLKFDMVNNPEVLQIVDQPLPLKFILQNLENHGLNLVSFETYSIWVRNDYQFFAIEKKSDFHEVQLSDHRNLFQKAVKKIMRSYFKVKYNYH